LENVLKIIKFNLHNNTGRFSLAAGDAEKHFSAELVEEFSKWVQGFLFCHLIFLPKICGGPILIQFCHTPLKESTENSGTHRKGAILGHLMFKVTFKTLLASFDIMQITSFDEQLSQQLQRKMATDAFFYFLPGGWRRPACCYSPARNLPINFLDLSFERRLLSLAW
jgi:hypothetical protein